MKKFPFFFLWLAGIVYGQQNSFDFYIEKENTIPVLQLKSKETFPCVGYAIRASQAWNNDTVIIDIRGFLKPANCPGGLDIAMSRFQLQCAAKKQFWMKIRWNATVDLWIISFDGENYTAEPVRNMFTSWMR